MIEVVLALGVVSIAIVAILAVFPTALATNRSANNEGRAAQLVRAITSTIDAQCGTFNNVTIFGSPALDLTSLTTNSPLTPVMLYATYASPAQPSISTSSAGAIYSIELRFDNNPPPTLGAGKLNLIQIRIFGNSKTEGATEFFYLARNKG
ncbi:MAG: hypothetical protein M3R59_06690 [Verrucomicrobiota bacterium]|nr:hypothetical protein [Verrucomicrobiota bacterium]